MGADKRSAPAYEQRVCANDECQILYDPTGSQQKLCPKCRAKKTKPVGAPRTFKERPCDVCERPFTPTNSNQRKCKKCASKHVTSNRKTREKDRSGPPRERPAPKPRPTMNIPAMFMRFGVDAGHLRQILTEEALSCVRTSIDLGLNEMAFKTEEYIVRVCKKVE